MLKERRRKAIEKVKRKKEKGWWDEKCRNMKEKVKKLIKNR